MILHAIEQLKYPTNSPTDADSRPKHLISNCSTFSNIGKVLIFTSTYFLGFTNCKPCTALSATLRGIGDRGKNILSLKKGPRGVDPVISIVVAQPHEPLSSPPPSFAFLASPIASELPGQPAIQGL